MEPAEVNVLIACEESQVEVKAFRALGFNAFSCDIQAPCGKRPEWHIQGDVSPFLIGKTNFVTSNGDEHSLSRWHLIVAHPPCTYLCKMGSVHMVSHGVFNEQRYFSMIEARNFFFLCLAADADFVAVENPIPMARCFLPKPSFYTCPSWFGYKYTKKTLWWVRGLPPVMPELFYPNPRSYVKSSRGKYRSRTFTGVADACASTWGAYIIHEYNKNNNLRLTTNLI